MRLSFSYVTEEQIDEGIARLARFVRDRGRDRAGASSPPDVLAAAGNQA